MTVDGLWLPSGRQHEPASALFMIIRGSFMAIYVKNKSVEYRPEANCHLSIDTLRVSSSGRLIFNFQFSIFN